MTDGPMTPGPHRRWFRFSLRGLFVVVTLFALLSAWMVYQLNWIRQRHQALDWLNSSEGSWCAPSLVGARTQVSAPWGLRLLGEQGIVGVGMDVKQFAGPVPYTPMQLQRLFPEARVDWSREGLYIIDP